MEDILKGLRESGFAPEVVEDDTGFAPINGKYIVRIDRAGRVKGTGKKSGKDYDFRTIKMQVVEIISGDKATNRYLDIAYNPDEEGTKKLLNDLFTAGIVITATTDEELDQELSMLTDKTLNVRAWARNKQVKVNDEWVDKEPAEEKQYVKIVKEFKGKKKSEEKQSEIPF